MILDDDPVTWLYMRIMEQQARALLRNEVDDELKAMARVMLDWQFELAKNAAKPMQTTTTRRVIRERRTMGTAPDSRTASTLRSDL